MSNAFAVATVVSNLKTYLEGLSWTSTSGTGTTTFSAVYTYDNFSHVGGNPFAVIRDEMNVSSTLNSNKYVEMATEITVYVCVNWSIVKDTQSDDEKREEAMVRLREASDYLKTQLIKETTESTLGVDFISEVSYTADIIEETDVFARAFRFSLIELQQR